MDLSSKQKIPRKKTSTARCARSHFLQKGSKLEGMKLPPNPSLVSQRGTSQGWQLSPTPIQIHPDPKKNIQSEFAKESSHQNPTKRVQVRMGSGSESDPIQGPTSLTQIRIIKRHACFQLSSYKREKLNLASSHNFHSTLSLSHLCLLSSSRFLKLKSRYCCKSTKSKLAWEGRIRNPSSTILNL